MDLDTRDTYRAMSDVRLLTHFSEHGPSIELCVALAERLADVLENPEPYY
jgi:predicted nucleotidyltransferase